MLIGYALVVFCKTTRILNRAEQMNQDKLIKGSEIMPLSNDIIFAFIIPNYKEDEDLLA